MSAIAPSSLKLGEVLKTTGYTLGDASGEDLSLSDIRPGTSKEEQEKSVSITTNGKIEIAPDTGKVLSKVIADVEVPSKGVDFSDEGIISIANDLEADAVAIAYQNISPYDNSNEKEAQARFYAIKEIKDVYPGGYLSSGNTGLSGHTLPAHTYLDLQPREYQTGNTSITIWGYCIGSTTRAKSSWLGYENPVSSGIPTSITKASLRLKVVGSYKILEICIG